MYCPCGSWVNLSHLRQRERESAHVHVHVHSLFQFEIERFTGLLQELCVVCVINVSFIHNTDHILTFPHNHNNHNYVTAVDQDKAIAHCYKILSTSGVTGRLRVAREVRGRRRQLFMCFLQLWCCLIALCFDLLHISFSSLLILYVCMKVYFMSHMYIICFLVLYTYHTHE